MPSGKAALRFDMHGTSAALRDIPYFWVDTASRRYINDATKRLKTSRQARRGADRRHARRPPQSYYNAPLTTLPARGLPQPSTFAIPVVSTCWLQLSFSNIFSAALG